MDRKFWLDVLLIGLLALLATMVIWICSELNVFASPDVPTFAYQVVMGLAVIALLSTIWTTVTRVKVGERRLLRWKAENQGALASTADQRRIAKSIDGLRYALRGAHGIRWRY